VTRDPLDDIASDPGVSELINALVSAPAPDELAGEQAALAMFTAIRSAHALGPAPDDPPVTVRTRSLRLGGRLAAAATVVVLAGGFAAAGYASALPSSIQHVAHQILGFAGVPDAPNHADRKGPGHGTGHPSSTQPVTHHASRASTSTSPAPSGSTAPSARKHSKASTSPSPRPRSPSPRPSSPGSSPPVQATALTITASQQQITAGASVSFTASLTGRGGGVPGVKLRLLGRTARRGGWRTVARATTNAQGQAVLTVGRLPVNATFLVTAARQHLRSGEVSVVVVPPVTVSVVPGSKRKQDLLVVRSPLAQRGNVVELDVLTPAGQWKLLRVHRLRQGKLTAFAVVVRKVSVTYQVVLVATPLHAQSVSQAGIP
jgi:hypothetical protein